MSYCISDLRDLSRMRKDSKAEDETEPPQVSDQFSPNSLEKLSIKTTDSANRHTQYPNFKRHLMPNYWSLEKSSFKFWTNYKQHTLNWVYLDNIAVARTKFLARTIPKSSKLLRMPSRNARRPWPSASIYRVTFHSFCAQTEGHPI